MVGERYFFKELQLDDRGRNALSRLSQLRIVRRRGAAGWGFYLRSHISREVNLDEPKARSGNPFVTIEDYLYVEGLDKKGNVQAYRFFPFSNDNLEKLRCFLEEIDGVTQR